MAGSSEIANYLPKWLLGILAVLITAAIVGLISDWVNRDDEDMQYVRETLDEFKRLDVQRQSEYQQAESNRRERITSMESTLKHIVKSIDRQQQLVEQYIKLDQRVEYLEQKQTPEPWLIKDIHNNDSEIKKLQEEQRRVRNEVQSLRGDVRTLSEKVQTLKDR